MQPLRQNQRTRGISKTQHSGRVFAPVLMVVILFSGLLSPTAQADTVDTVRQWAFTPISSAPLPASLASAEPWYYVARWTVGKLYPMAYFRHVAESGQLDQVIVMTGPGQILIFDAQARLIEMASHLPFVRQGRVSR